jgi:hypothetical protein
MDLQKSHVADLAEKSKNFETLSKRIDNLEQLLTEKDGLVQVSISPTFYEQFFCMKGKEKTFM